MSFSTLPPGPVIIDPFKIIVTNHTAATFPLVSESVTSTPSEDTTTVDEKPGAQLRPKEIADLAWRFNGNTTSPEVGSPGTTGTVVYQLAKGEPSTTSVGFRIVLEPYLGIPPKGTLPKHPYFQYVILTTGGVEEPANPWITPAGGWVKPFGFTAPGDPVDAYSITITPFTNDDGDYYLHVNIRPSDIL